jgi:manganese/zinc/iron transport system permease protein
MSAFTSFLQVDVPALAAGALAAMSCAVIGCFLVLRRMSLMGDAISHAVLPGIIAAFLLTGSLKALPVFIGGAAIGIVTAFLSELIHRLGRVEGGAAMGIVFTTLFAIGVIMLEQIGGRHIHLDADCVLYGQMEGVVWTRPPRDWSDLFSAETWHTVPRQVLTLALVLLANIAFIALFFKELRIASFDPGLAAAQGISPAIMHSLVMTFVAMTTVAAFEAVGSILVVAMLIAPALIAHLLTDRLWVMIVLSAAAALAASSLGYAGAAAWSVNSAGMIGLALGAALVLTGLFSPRHGWLSRAAHRAALSISILREDMLGLLHRLGEMEPGGVPGAGGGGRSLTPAQVRAAVGGGPLAAAALWRLVRRGEAANRGRSLELTPLGAGRAASIVRSHRLWESYLVRHLGLHPMHVHDTAMQLEHITGSAMQDRLAERTDGPTTDPHGRPIPAAEDREAS